MEQKMRKIEKFPSPEILKEKGPVWKKKMLDYMQTGEKIPDLLINKYRHPKIKDVLINESFGKCVYCESKILHIDYGDIEHIIPKSKEPIKSIEWENLTLSCGKCNQKKSDYYDPENPLVHPFTDTPEEEIYYFGPIAKAVPGSLKGELTVSLLELNRPELIERRSELLNRMDNLLHLHKLSKGALKEELLKDIISYTEQDKEYSSLVQNLVQLLMSKVS
ncbi:HNH endonuclease [Bacillus toyonensis]|uniref:HNH endonuclease n=1 Tax=Bacillus toyonensis TaxID=155322 RepID=UPI0021D197DB|nr:HNH endonuclease signature motif containing protein [Bacillus toyonensis]MCU5725115.1 HNH endonuclease [Bacillus toyonensis]